MNERWLITGGRDFRDFRFLVDTLDELVKKRGTPEVLISGGQRTKTKTKEYIGADHYAEEWARFNGVPFMVFPIADFQWKTIGKSAGPARNKMMLLFGKPNVTIAFEGGCGTADMVLQSKRHKLIKIIQPKRKEHADPNSD